MFVVPFSLFLIATYLRPRTQAELSGLIAAIECMSGLWCLLFAPPLIQLTLIGIFLVQNASTISSVFNPQPHSSSKALDLSNPLISTIDIQAEPIIPSPTAPSLKDQPIASDISRHTLAPQGQHTLTPQAQTENHLHIRCLEQQNATLTVATQWVQMQYRGVTYLKPLKQVQAPSRHPGKYRGVATQVAI